MKKLVCLSGLLIFAFLLSGSFTTTAHAQTKGAWVEYKLPSERPGDWGRIVGENCLIYRARSDSTIYAFDINSGAWHSYTAATDLEWSGTSKYAGKNVAFISNDEMAVAYSALTQEFVPITYSGSLLGYTTYDHDCKGDMAYFVTDQYFYVFDGEDAVWHIHDISDMGDVSSWGVYGTEDYILLFVKQDDNSKKIVAYSYITKTFAGYDGAGNIQHEELQYGFVFYKTNSQSDSLTHFFAGYTASSGTYEKVMVCNHHETPNAMIDRGIPATTFYFTKNVKTGDNSRRHDMYGFDTRFGNFVEYSFDWTYNCDDVHVYGIKAGGSIAVDSRRDCNSGEVTYFVYNGNTNSFSTVPSSMIYPACGVTIPQPGGEIFSVSDCENLWFYDPQNMQGAIISLPNPSDDYSTVRHRMYDTWGIVDCKESQADMVHLYSYNQSSNNIQEIQVACHTAFNKLDSTNVGGFYAPYRDGNKKLLMYSPVTDTWVTKNLGPSETGWGRGIERDLIYWYHYSESGPMNIFDGVTGIETTIPFGWNAATTAYTYIYPESNFLMVHSADDRYCGYSTYTRTNSEYSRSYMGLPSGHEDLAVMSQNIYGGGADILAYNVLYDNFVMTSFGPEYGTYFNVCVGGKTALIMTIPGHLLAWDPNAESSTDIDNNIGNTKLPESYSLSQNYPNPFNPSTVISYSIPKQSDVTISIINLLGQKIKTIKNENQIAGKHEIKWDGTDQSGRTVASGIYFYKINSGDYTESKKMIMLK